MTAILILNNFFDWMEEVLKYEISYTIFLKINSWYHFHFLNWGSKAKNKKNDIDRDIFIKIRRTPRIKIFWTFKSFSQLALFCIFENKRDKSWDVFMHSVMLNLNFIQSSERNKSCKSTNLSFSLCLILESKITHNKFLYESMIKILHSP